MLFVSSCQVDAVYQAWNNRIDDIDVWVNNGGFAAIHINDLNDGQMDRLEALLDEADNDLCNWIIGKEPVPAQHDNDVMTWLKKFNNCS